MNIHPLRVISGFLVCVVVLAAPWLILRSRGGPIDTVPHAEAPSVAGSLWTYCTRDRRTLQLRFPVPTDVAVGDPIFMREGAASLWKIGQIEALLVDGQVVPLKRALVLEAQATIYELAPTISDGYQIEYRTTPESLAWVVNVLLTDERREQVERELRASMFENRDAIADSLRPALQSAFREILAILETDLPPALQRHQAELHRLGERYQKEIVQGELLPLTRSEIMPVVRQHVEPELQAIGRELWDRLSLFRFGWRMAYDVLPLVPEKQLVDKEWQRFVSDEAMPILEAHSEKFAEIVAAILSDLAKNEKLREAIRLSMLKILDDAEAQALVRTIFREVVSDNPRMREMLARYWASSEVQQAMAMTETRLEPMIRRVADILFGTRAEGLTPEFAHILRTQILKKDRRWFLLVDSTSSEPVEADRHRLPASLRVRYGK